MNFSIKDFFCKCDQIRRILWSHLQKKSLMENFMENFVIVFKLCIVFNAKCP